ncbi:hypothetical protein WS68_01445 [Burkholderia sp. TSV86]|nr:hypothetical protein WS68_01445 [Burkholderia sp. TSV86]
MMELFNATVETAEERGLLSGEHYVAPALLSYFSHVLTGNRHGLLVNVQASRANGRAELDIVVQMLRKSRASWRSSRNARSDMRPADR